MLLLFVLITSAQATTILSIMGSRILSWLSFRGRSPKVPSQDVEIQAEVRAFALHYRSSRAYQDRMPAQHIRRRSSSHHAASPRDLVSLTQVCKDLCYFAEEALYHRVSVGPRLSQLRSFLDAVCASDHRAAAVRTLRMRVPGVVFSPARSTVLQKLSGHATSTAARSHYSVGASEAGGLQDMIAQAFGRLVNLKELDFDDLQTFPAVCASSVLQLTELKTTGDALSKAISDLRSPSSADSELSPSALVSVERLTVDLFNPWLQLSELRFLHITHLFLDRARFLSPTDLQNSLPLLPNLISLRVMWSASQAPDGRDGVTTLWPTRILGAGPLPRLRRLELCERRTQRVLQTVHADSDLNADVEAHLAQIRASCPSITTLVWWASGYHCHLAGSADANTRAQFCEALRRYTEGLFARWPSLVRFERQKLEDDPPKDGFTAFVRGQDGCISDEPAEYDEGRWRVV
ncbi:hypothetical protein L226DRAFT_613892 [Lentinus tigrinus ALCF2SS1-7]|uniref:uncharacterized protein n=1 Tax=Lentinus tigrinus ALCF2SS1-7 TaxID=1328758 RepID=UPI001165F55F|nr:hypothetical protein L226DRAFT_613892 [Lentinus tigrinus ALCF2SS1-7]